MGSTRVARPSSSMKEFAAFQRHSTGFGAKMLEKMGWQKGKGLGSAGQGVAEPVVAVSNGGGTTGLGAAAVVAEQRKWKRAKKKARFEASKAARAAGKLEKRRSRKAKARPPLELHGCYLCAALLPDAAAAAAAFAAVLRPVLDRRAKEREARRDILASRCKSGGEGGAGGSPCSAASDGVAQQVLENGVEMSKAARVIASEAEQRRLIATRAAQAAQEGIAVDKLATVEGQEQSVWEWAQDAVQRAASSAGGLTGPTLSEIAGMRATSSKKFAGEQVRKLRANPYADEFAAVQTGPAALQGTPGAASVDAAPTPSTAADSTGEPKKGQCAWCGHNRVVAKNRVVPRSLRAGGRKLKVMACSWCSTSRGGKTVGAWLEELHHSAPQHKRVAKLLKEGTITEDAIWGRTAKSAERAAEKRRRSDSE